MEKSILYIGIIIGVIFIFILLILWAIYEDKKSFNNGFCLHCGTKIRNFSVDRRGGRGYCCDKCNYHTWIRYGIDKT